MIDADLPPKKYPCLVRRRKDGSIRDVLVNVEIVPGTKKCIVSVLDITDRLQAEEKLEQGERLFRSVFARSSECMFLCDLEGNFKDANPAALNLLGYEREDIPSLNYSSLLDPLQYDAAVRIMNEIAEIGYQKLRMTYRLRHKNG